MPTNNFTVDYNGALVHIGEYYISINNIIKYSIQSLSSRCILYWTIQLELVGGGIVYFGEYQSHREADKILCEMLGEIYGNQPGCDGENRVILST